VWRVSAVLLQTAVLAVAPCSLAGNKPVAPSPKHSLSDAPPADAPAAKKQYLTIVRVTPELTASLTREYEIDVAVRPHKGDAWSRLAKRVTGDGERWKEIAAHNAAGEKLTTDDSVLVPFLLLRPQLQRQIVHALFPGDGPAAEGWRHVVIGSTGVEGESLWNIATWFTGDGASYGAVRKANPRQGLSTRKGDVILIPKELLAAAFAGGAARPEKALARGEARPAAPTTGRSGGVEEQNAAASAPAEIRNPENDPVERPSADANVPEPAVEAVASGVPALTYDRSGAEPFAVYKLQKGEALYSSVAIRFTGRVYSKDVGDVLERIVKFNDIEDVARLRVGYRVKIPIELLLPEYRPADDPTRVAREQAQRESARLVKRTRARNLAGVQIILDPGHGGRDVGAAHEDVFEARYVYDVTCRLKQVLEKNTDAKVWITTRSQSGGYAVAQHDALDPQNDHVVLTTPRYTLDDSTVGVHLRWYLANSIFHRAMKSGIAREKVVFISIHADSLHPSLRGAMAYIPGERYVMGSFQKSGEVYLARAEVREAPLVRHSEKESLAAEGLSRDFAETVMDSIEEAGLKVHPFNPVRDNVVREGHEWVPAVIRYNMVPTRMLLEVCNLGNARDREQMKTKKYRQQVADAISHGIETFFSETGTPTPSVVASRAR
jgi:N-acetylmuramoyl-L-alanine amidase